MSKKFNIAIVALFLIVIMIGFNLINELATIKNLIANKKELKPDSLGGIQLKSIIALVIVLVMIILVMARDYFNKRYILTLKETTLPNGDKIKETLEKKVVLQESEKAEEIENKKKAFNSIFNNSLTNDSLLKLVVDTLDASSGGLFELDSDKKIQVLSEFARVIDVESRIYTDLSDQENLLGSALMNSKMSFINDLPEGYVSIKSGLGEGSPKSILFIPFNGKNGERMTIELALFKNVENEYFELISFVNERLNRTEFNNE